MAINVTNKTEEPTNNSDKKDLQEEKLTSPIETEQNSIPLQEPINVEDLDTDNEEENKGVDTTSSNNEDIPIIPE